ncbi:cobalamin B12-binding domain-containing protein [Georhizobium profundi]|nr:cobalamin B12-binding domain-containing protein [Georhizobium profundi]
MSDTAHRIQAVGLDSRPADYLRQIGAQRPFAPLLPIDDMMIAAFTETLRAPGFWACESAVDILRDRLQRRQTIQDAVFAPAARLAGAYWSSDVWSFLDVTVAVSRLKRLLVQEVRQRHRPPNVGARSILLSAAPGETHDFGLHYVALAFERAGYAVDLRTGADEAELMAALVMHRYDLVGLSLSAECLLDRLTLFIGNVRNKDKTRDVLFLVGGNAFVSRPEYAVGVGADFLATDPDTAVYLAQLRLGSHAGREQALAR